MPLNEGLLKSSGPVKDPCSRGTHKTQTAARQALVSRLGEKRVGERGMDGEGEIGRQKE